MLVIAPILWSYVRDEMKSERLVLNEIASFIDKTTDKASITKADLDDLYLGVNAAGGTYDVKVKRYIRLSTLDENNEPRTLYLSDDYIDKTTGKATDMNIGDVVKVTVDEVGMSPAKRLLWTLLRVDSGESKFSLAGSVR
jgi:hypothetical protein